MRRRSVVLLAAVTAPTLHGLVACAPKDSERTPMQTDALETKQEPAAAPRLEDVPIPGRGLVRTSEGLEPGAVLFAPLRSTTTYLVDRAGEVVHTWKSDRLPGAAVAMLADGRLIRAEQQENAVVFSGGGAGGRLHEITWDGEVTWEYRIADEHRRAHHDFEVLANGDVLVIAWERKTPAEAIAVGRHPDTMKRSEFWPDALLQVRPLRPEGGEVVWEWHAFDHLVQDLDPQKAHYGDVAAHPERIDVNADVPPGGPVVRVPRPQAGPDDPEIARLVALGYLPGKTAGEPLADWTHCNCVRLDEERDLLVVGARRLHEFWVIDHSTTTQEAASSAGGRYGKGGDLLFRFGARDRLFDGQHDVRWVASENGAPPHFLLFDNGVERGRSRVLELRWKEPFQGAFPPPERWHDALEVGSTYPPDPATPFFAGHLSSAERLSGGNTLICDGVASRIFEVTPAGEVVWDYLSPFGATPDQPGHPGGIFRATFVPAERLESLLGQAPRDR